MPGCSNETLLILSTPISYKCVAAQTVFPIGVTNTWQTSSPKSSNKLLQHTTSQQQDCHNGLVNKEGLEMLWTVLVILVILWLVGFFGYIGGSLIHILLVLAVIVLILNFVSGRRG